MLATFVDGPADGCLLDARQPQVWVLIQRRTAAIYPGWPDQELLARSGKRLWLYEAAKGNPHLYQPAGTS